MRTVKNILESKQKSNNTTTSDTLVIDALNILNSVNLSYLVVMDNGEYKGIFSERDYSRNVVLKGRSSNTTTVGEVMTVDLPTVNFTDSVEYCMNTMIINKTRYLLAYDTNGKFAGVITIHDLLREILANREEVFDTTTAQELLDEDESGNIY